MDFTHRGTLEGLTAGLWGLEKHAPVSAAGGIKGYGKTYLIYLSGILILNGL